MTPERYEQIGRLYHAALAHQPAARAAFLAEVCGSDEALCREVESLLAAHEQAGDFIQQPPTDVAAGRLIAAALPARSFAHYRLLSLLGQGGMGAVWLAEDTQLNRQVAVKLLPAEFTHDAERVRRFAQESRAVSALNHPNIITIHEIGEVEDAHYIVTEYVAGETLRQRLLNAPDQRLKPAEAIELAAQIAAALSAAHEAGITHRDIKPENVMVRGDGLVKVLDFGLAKLTELRIADGGLPNEEAGALRQIPQNNLQSAIRNPQSTDPGVVLGTPRYMSPEQARGEQVDARTDIFSLGVLLYELLAGRPPFAGATTNDLIAALLQDEPPPLAQAAPAAPPELARILGKALHKDRAERYQTVKEFWLELKDLTEAQAFAARLERSDSASRTAPPAARAASFVSRSKTSLVIALAVLLSALAAIAYFTNKASDDSLAVLPFVNAGGDGNDDYLPDGLTETLINNLSQLPHLKVIARSSVFRYKGRAIDPQAAGRELGVRAVLTGSVTQRGDSLRISAELMNVADKSHLWGQQFDVKAGDLLAVQEELARQISAGLRVKITGEDQQRLAKRYTANPEAYRFYLLGRFFWNKFGPEANRKAIENFNLAIAQDPGYALAYAGLAKAYGAMGLNGEAPPREVLPKSKAAVLKALELDDQLAEAHAALAGTVMFFERDWSTAERELRRSLELNANDPLTHVIYSYFLTARGRFDEALAQAKLNQQLDPVSLPMYANLVRAYYYARRYDEAIETNRKALELDPNFPTTHLFAGAAYEQKGRYEEAIVELQQANRILRGFPAALGALGHVYAVSGRRDEALKTLAELTAMSGQRHVSPLDLAILYTGLGDQAQALEQLEKAAEDRVGWLINLPVEPRFDGLRAEPRFQALLRRIGQTP